MRLAIGGIFHETNTYADESTGLTGLDRFQIHRGEEIITRNKGNRSQIGGMLAAAERLGIEVVPVLDAQIMPSGTLVREAYDTVKAEFLAGLAAASLDAVALNLHGAGVAEGVDDLEADSARAVRALIGPDVPVLAVLDLHGNITPAMAEVLRPHARLPPLPAHRHVRAGRGGRRAAAGAAAGRAHAGHPRRAAADPAAAVDNRSAATRRR